MKKRILTRDALSVVSFLKPHRFRDTAFQFRMPAGIPGNISRAWASPMVEPQEITPFGTTGAPTAYGLGGLIDATTGMFRVPAAGDAALNGVLVRSFPTNSTQNGLGVSTPPLGGIIDMLKIGYMSVLLQNVTACKKQGAVYCCIQNAPVGGQVGGFEAAANGNNILVTNAYFTGPADANGNTEVRFLF